MANVNGSKPHDDEFNNFLDALPQKPATTIRMFDRNEFYTVHGEDAKFIANDFFENPSALKTYTKGPEGTPPPLYVNLSKSQFESAVRHLLLVRNYCVEIYKKNSSKNSDWSLYCKGSPGNLTDMEEFLFGMSSFTESQGIISLKIKQDKQEQLLGISYADAILRKILIVEFNDNDHFSSLQSIIVQLSPKECLIPCLSGDQAIHYTKVKEILKRNKILVTECKSSLFSENDLVQDLNRLVKFGKGERKQISTKAEFQSLLAMTCTSAVIKYLELMKDDSNFGQFTLNFFHPELYMKLDYAAIKALAVLPISQKEGDRSLSLLSFLNKCRTAGGQRLLLQWLKQPLMDVKKIEERLNVVDALVQSTQLRQTLFDNYLRKVPDLQRFSKKFQRKKANLQDCYRIYLMVMQIPQLKDQLEKMQLKVEDREINFQSVFIEPLQELQADFEKFLQMVESTIDMDLVETGEYLVRSDFDQDLKDLREQLSEIEGEIQTDIKQVAKDLSLEAEKVLKLEKSPQIGWHYRISRKEEKVLRNKRNYFTIDTKNNGVRFHSSNLRSLNTSFLKVRGEVEQQQKKVVDLIIDIAAGYSDSMAQLGELTSHLDVLVSLSVVAVSAPRPFVRPKLLSKGSGKISLKQARHPLVEVQKTVGFIPNDALLETDKSNFHIITGPNMGGKSTFIRSVALNVLLAQIGSFVACDEAEISVADSIMTRVGAGDKQIKGISTFMAEMLETSSILRSATKDSLLVIDELGRGTSTYDGFGLAWAISKEIASANRSFCLFATHFHELTDLANEFRNIQNFQVTALTSESSLTLLYKVMAGVCDQSFGIHVAELARFPKDIIEMAKEKVMEFEALQTQDFRNEASSDNKCVENKRKLQEEKDNCLQNFFKKVKQVADDLQESEAMEALENLKEELKNSDNSEIQKFLRQLAPTAI